MIGYVYDRDNLVGELRFFDGVYSFIYNKAFLDNRDSQSISLTLPKQQEPFISPYLHPFFANLLAEGISVKMVETILKTFIGYKKRALRLLSDSFLSQEAKERYEALFLDRVRALGYRFL